MLERVRDNCEKKRNRKVLDANKIQIMSSKSGVVKTLSKSVQSLLLLNEGLYIKGGPA